MYKKAVRAYRAFVSQDDKFIRAGELTKQASSFYRRYATDWADQWGALTQIVNSNGKALVQRVVTVYESELAEDGARPVDSGFAHTASPTESRAFAVD